MKLILKAVKRACLRCNKEFVDTTGCVLCPECVARNESINKMLEK